MAWYYFNIRDGEELIRDYEGHDCESLSAAKQEALGAARDLVADAVRSGEPPNHREVEITDEQGGIVATVPFSAALKGKTD